MIGPWLLCLAVLLQVPSASAEDDHTIAIKPKLCLKKRLADFCDIEVDIYWKANQIDHYCVVDTTSGKTIACWENHLAGEAKDEVHTQVDLNYVLMQEGNNEQLVSQALNVLSLEDDTLGKNRRRRHVWSLF